MKAISRIALGISLALAGGSLALAPAVAKKSGGEEAQTFNLSQPVSNALQAAQKAIAAKDYATAQSSIATAEAAIKNEDDRFQVGAFKLSLGTAMNDQNLQSQGIDLAVASGKGTLAQKKELLHNQGALALNAKNPQKAEQAFTQLVALDPNDTANVLTLAQLKSRNGKGAEAMATVSQAINAQKAAGKPVPEDWYRTGLAIANDTRNPAGTEMAVGLLQNYPSPTNWRDALTVYRTANKLDAGANLDVMRLLRAAGALKGESDYYEYASAAMTKGLPGEAKAVVDEGSAAGAINASRPVFQDVQALSGSKIAQDKASLPKLEAQAKSAPTGKLAANTAEAYLGYKQYAQAAALYRVALQKGGIDAAEVNTRIGIALALSGDKAGAQQAFAQVTGPRAAIAKFWTIWLNRAA
jgi:Tfp pilus assembly protein PilF